MSLIEIVPYDPTWPALFQVEATRIRRALGEFACRIDHVGSTSVPGLGAKPVIDIQISVRQLHPMEPYVIRLCELGYSHVPHPDDEVCPFLHRPKDWPHTHHIHVCQLSSLEERRHLAFRDFLRDHSEVAEVYYHEKMALAPNFSADTFESRNAYADAKSAFIEPVVQRALAEGYPLHEH